MFKFSSLPLMELYTVAMNPILHALYIANWSASFQLGFLIMLFSFKLSVSFVSVACLETSYLEAKCMTIIKATFTFTARCDYVADISPTKIKDTHLAYQNFHEKKMNSY